LQKILLSGASGLIGSALQVSLATQVRQRETEIVRLSRGTAKDASEISWDLQTPLSPDAVSGFDAVIHLAGESVVGRWTDEKKKSIRDSRVLGTRNLSAALAKASPKPKVFICASAIGYYGDRGDETLREESSSGSGFLPEVCREWEAATRIAVEAGIRTINLRTGLVLSEKGGALQSMLTPFKLGLGGRIGSGRQWWSWIHMDDMVGAIHHAMNSESMNSETLSGPVNMTAPNPVRNADFTKILGGVLGRPTIMRVPPFALKLIFGTMATEEMFLASQRVAPEKLLQSSYNFRYVELGPALESLL
jgi:uncharacterized protein (TIGR01777 family)